MMIGFGAYHSCFFVKNQVKCVGDNNRSGQLGLVDNESNVKSKSMTYDVVDLSANNERFSENDADSLFYSADFGLEKATDVAGEDDSINKSKIYVGAYHTCIIMDHNKKLKCIGNNSFGQLGYGDLINRGSKASDLGENLQYVEFGDDVQVIQISLGMFHSCARLNNNMVKCFGNNNQGQLGISEQDMEGKLPRDLAPVDFGAGRDASEVISGYSHSCLILDSYKALKCWGDNRYGQLGLGDTISRGIDQSLMGNSLPDVDIGLDKKKLKIKQVSLGVGHSCALTSNGLMKCWGQNMFGQLGLGDNDDRGVAPNQMGINLPYLKFQTKKGQEARITSISTGHLMTCGVVESLGVKCWGYNWNDQLGTGKTSESESLPNKYVKGIKVSQETKISRIVTSEWRTCVLIEGSSSRLIQCFGPVVYGNVKLFTASTK